MSLTLHCFGESGNAYKAALTLELAGLDWTAAFVDFFNGAARTDSYKEINEMGEVPVLVDTTTGLNLSQSGVIQDWVVRQTGRLGGQTDEDRQEVLRWLLWDNHKMSSQAGICRFLMNFLPEEKRPQPVIEWYQNRLKAAYTVLNDRLSDRDWVAIDELSIADIACAGYLYYPEPFGFDRTDWPNIDAWLTRLSETPGWKHPYDLMPGRPSDHGL